MGARDLPVPPEFNYALRFVEQIAAESVRVRHAFLGSEEFAAAVKEEPSIGSKIYWEEILARAHIAAHLSILRTRAWMSGLEIAWRASNTYLYAAAFRGLLEGTADTWFSLRDVPLSIATDHYRIRRAIAGKANRMSIAAELETRLIHFTHARRLDKQAKAQAPDAHEAKQIQAYLRSFGADYEAAALVYDRLCAFTHPSAESLMLFVKDYTADSWELVEVDQKELIAGLQASFTEVFAAALMKAFNLPIALLKLLNTFDDLRFRTNAADGIDLRRIPVWSKITAAISASARTPIRR
jgi:hypothetical protein